MSKLVVGITILTVVAGAIVFFSPLQSSVAGTLGTAVDTGPEGSQVVPPVKADPRVLAEAKVVPVREASLSMPTSGIVAQVLAREGDPVEAGQLLLRLANAHQQATVAQAQAALYAARARLEELQQGPRPQEIKAAQATLDAAQARLNGLFESPTPEEIAVAEAVVGSAQATLGKVLEGARDEELTAARAEMANAEAELKRAQTEYDKLGWRNDRAALNVSVELEQATNTYVAAEARYEALVRGATEGDIAGAVAGVRQAEAELQRVIAAVKDSDIAAAQAEIHRAQAQLELMQAGARPEQVAAAEADVVAAEAVLEQAQVALGEAELRAPFAGTVASQDVKVGEAVVMGVPAAQLADLSAWWIETEDLTEMDVVSVEEGDPVLITVDALPDVELLGRVVRIKPIGVNRHGDMTYTVIVKPQGTDRRLRWNMTSMVAIEPRES
jgi:HlyD family secretion protein